MVSFIEKSQEICAFGCIISPFRLNLRPCDLAIWFWVENVRGVRGGNELFLLVKINHMHISLKNAEHHHALIRTRYNTLTL